MIREELARDIVEFIGEVSGLSNEAVGFMVDKMARKLKSVRECDRIEERVTELAALRDDTANWKKRDEIIYKLKLVREINREVAQIGVTVYDLSWICTLALDIFDNRKERIRFDPDRLIEAVVTTLSETERRLLLMKYKEGMMYREMCSRMGMGYGDVYLCIDDSLRKLRKNEVIARFELPIEEKDDRKDIVLDNEKDLNSIRSLYLPQEVVDTLKKNGVEKVTDLYEMTLEKVSKIPGIGNRGAAMISTALNIHPYGKGIS
ncbi:MAG: hypothetical protein IJG64_03065 [Oscillospiraceae bacterium]|nr:hypothetical protein [Oscillospiraceae bacterium]